MVHRFIGGILEDMKASGMKIDAITTGYVASYELGNTLQQLFYATVRGADLREGHVAQASTEMADCIMQLRVLAEIFGLEWSSLVAMGEAKLYERIEEFNMKVRPRPDVELSKGTALPITKSRPTPQYTHSGD